MMVYQHIPVMLKEVIEYLNPQRGQNFIDCTLGGAGYTMAIAEKIGQEGKVLAIDLDELAIENAKKQIAERKLRNIILVQDNFRNIREIAQKYFKTEKIQGIIFDLGLSSAQLDDRKRGFSFQIDAPLDMRFNSVGNLSAEYIVNNCKQEELEKIFKEYGEERFAKQIAGLIVQERKVKPIAATLQLVEAIKKAIPKKFAYGKIHPATKVFQALRIAVNKELENIEQALPQAKDLLAPGGRIAVVAFHSLEDRIVKNYFKREAKDCLCPPEFPVCRCGHKKTLKILTKKTVIPNIDEARNNPRARSAKLRAAEKI